MPRATRTAVAPGLRPTRAADVGPARLVAYSASLDGLRGVSVLLVVAYHLGLSWAVGGFVGVDVFFVVSGYLITALLLAERSARGTIDLRAFWTRRVRRLLPSVLVLVIAVLVAERLWPTFEREATLRGDALSVLGYFSNWRFIFTGSSYFDQYAAPSPFRHTWSLAIEEQWYIAWPVVVALVAARRHGHRLLAIVTLSLAALSAIAMVLLHTPGADPSRSYYGTDTRAQALLVGAGLAIAMSGRLRNPGGRMADRVGRPLAMGAVVLLGWVVTQKPSFDVWFYEGGATVVALAAVVLVWACVGSSGPHRGLVARVFASRPLVHIGLRSYAIYLWHWPVIVYCNATRTGVHGTSLTVLRAAITLVLAEGSYRVVENPIRRSRVGALRLVVGGGAIAALVAFLLVPVSSRPSNAIAAPIAPPIVSAEVTATDVPARAPVGVLVVGDSVAFRLIYHWRPDPTLGLDPHNAAIIGCGMAGGSLLRGGHPVPPPPECDDVDEVWSRAIAELHPDVIVAMFGPLELQDRRVDGVTLRVGTEEYAAHLRQRLQHATDVATQSGARLLLTDVPCFGTDDAIDSGIGDERGDTSRIAAVNEVFRSAAASDPRITLLPISDLLCPDGRYTEKIDGVQMRDDGVHFTPAGALITWRWLAARIQPQ